MSETTNDDQAMERRNRNRLASAAAIVVLTVLSMVVVQLVRRSLNSVASIARSHLAERRQSSDTGSPGE